jgi:transposase-like protein
VFFGATSPGTPSIGVARCRFNFHMSFTPIQKHSFLITYWESGRKATKVAPRLGVSTEIIRRWEYLLRNSAELIFQDEPERKVEAVIAYYESGRRLGEIAEKYKVSGATIQKWKDTLENAMGVIFGPRGGWGEIIRLRRTLAKREAECLDLDAQIKKYQALYGNIEESDVPRKFEG